MEGTEGGTPGVRGAASLLKAGKDRAGNVIPKVAGTRRTGSGKIRPPPPPKLLSLIPFPFYFDFQ